MKISLFLFCFALSNVYCYNYLVSLPVAGYSHLKFMAKLANVLADGGHNVTALMSHHAPLKNIDGLIKNKNIEIINYYPDNFEELKKGKEETFEQLWDTSILNNPILGMFVFPKLIMEKFGNLGRQLLQDEEFHAKLKARNFDAIVVETFEMSPFYLAHLIDIQTTISVISGSRFSTFSLVGQPDNIGYIPGEFSQTGPEAGFLDRLNDVYYSVVQGFSDFALFEIQHKEYVKLIGRDDIPKWQDMVANSPFYFANSNPYLDFAMSNVGKIVNIGGITIDKKKRAGDIPQEYEDILKERPSTVLISFGSVVRSFQMPETYKTSFLKLFESLPDVTFIWKYEKDDEMMQKIPKNVYLKKWVPQPALLADKRVKLFITHGGLGSTMEVAYSGKPAITIPLFGDQPTNALMLARHGGSQAYNKRDVPNSQKLIEVVTEMIENPKYNKNAKQLQEILHNQPIDPKENLLKHMEFAVKFPKLEKLIPENHKNGFIAFYYIDVLLFLGTVSGLFMYFVYRLAHRLIFSRKVKTE